MRYVCLLLIMWKSCHMAIDSILYPKIMINIKDLLPQRDEGMYVSHIRYMTST